MRLPKLIKSPALQTIIAAILATILFLQFLAAPFPWLFVSWFIAFLLVARCQTRTLGKALFFYLSFVPLAFCIFETYLWMAEKPEEQAYLPKTAIIRNHAFLGYAPLKNSAASHMKYYGQEFVFNAVYTIDSDGLRMSPPYHVHEGLGSILFFGGSFTYGTGVNDRETMPYQVGIKTRGRYRIYNFGFRGYGPHQMLSALEHGLVERIVKARPRYAIYQALPGHIGRAAGLGFWDVHGPRYILNKEGKIVNKGHFDKRLTSLLIKSHIFRKILVRNLGRIQYEKKHVDLFIEIVLASKKMIEALYPGCEFHLIFWDDNLHKSTEEVLTRLREKQIGVHPVSHIFNSQGASIRPSDLRISKHDAHPTPLAHEIIADYVAREIIKE
jgi:hypothetical protein